MDGAAPVYASRHEPLLGTRIDLRIRAAAAEVADRARGFVVGEIERLAGVFSVYDEFSELCRWRRGEIEPGPELTEVLVRSLAWQRSSEGTYNPAVERVGDRWREAAASGCEPSTADLACLVASIAEPAYDVVGGRIRVTGDVSRLSLNAFAKGWIVDRALAAGASIDGVEGLTVNAGGDLAHVGPSPVAVGIEDPARPFDNVAPLAVIDVRSGGLATSGSARRGFRVGPRWFGHVIDPRSGHPVDTLASVSVIAHDAATADVVATVVGVAGIDDGFRFVATLDGVGCLVVTNDGECIADEVWRASQRPSERVRPW